MHYSIWFHFGLDFLLLGLAIQLCMSSTPQSEHHREIEGTCFYVHSYDGSYNERCLIFSKGLQIWKSVALGEADLGHPPAYLMCFATTLDKGEMQLNNTLLQTKTRVTDLGNQEALVPDMDTKTVSLEWVLDMHTTKQALGRLEDYCLNADVVYMTKSFVDKILSDETVVNTKLLTTAIESLPISNGSAYPTCEDARHNWELGCICKRLICMTGFPCDPVSCQGREEQSSDCISKTCTKCTNFQFYVPNKRNCFWNIKV